MADKNVLVKNVANVQINPASEESVVLLRRILKVLESNAVVDSSQRQRVIADSVGALPTLSNVTTVATVTTVNQLSGVDAKWTIIDIARNTYANGIRSKLIWS